MRLLLMTTSTDESGYNADADYAIVTIDMELAKKIAARRRHFDAARTEDSMLANIQYSSANARFYRQRDRNYYSNDVLEIFEKCWSGREDLIEIPDDLDLAFLDEANPSKGVHGEIESFDHFVASSDIMTIYSNVMTWTWNSDTVGVDTTLVTYDYLAKMI